MPGPVPRRAPFAARAFHALLSRYPAAFRDEYGRELSLVFADRYRDSAGVWDRVRISSEAFARVVIEAPKEHMRMIVQDLGYAMRLTCPSRA